LLMYIILSICPSAGIGLNLNFTHLDMSGSIILLKRLLSYVVAYDAESSAACVYFDDSSQS
jgi:hypothetical protein